MLEKPVPDLIKLPKLGSSGTFTLTAEGGQVTFTITAPAGLKVSEPSGTLAAGKSVTITVTTTGNGPKLFDNELTIDPGQSVEVDYEPKG